MHRPKHALWESLSHTSAHTQIVDTRFCSISMGRKAQSSHGRPNSQYPVIYIHAACELPASWSAA